MDAISRGRNVAALMAELRGKRWDAGDARRALAVWRESGLSASAFGREHEMDEQRLNWWRKRLSADSKPTRKRAPKAAGRLVPAVVRVPTPTSAGMPDVVIRAGGLVIEADSRVVSAEWLALLIAELARR